MGRPGWSSLMQEDRDGLHPVMLPEFGSVTSLMHEEVGQLEGGLSARLGHGTLYHVVVTDGALLGSNGKHCFSLNVFMGRQRSPTVLRPVYPDIGLGRVSLGWETVYSFLFFFLFPCCHCWVYST
ncbi:uncharacterized protein BP01DRAFT_38138 [Aspergillus saccharolyticus JOP 1030-1]|uniref:Uncharacterized protein n=1 Tax=Aspergillus saccharolyticus JOP 1030-1 TaxID=1450539 RepID=A0A318ZHB5_9EURO|nr:hypothetical protein BP01DRAFT_38138 [Aspergillus saccharolyticus JOP 1030-1]PYH45744.1 hypothetical protein BP01DRAFT_38138 [Aspergillus saccharolyticus JOP 1030-1]